MAIPISSRWVLARWLAIAGVLALVWTWAGVALGEEPVPSLEALLSAGVENHPTVAAAKAKVALAEAELNSTRFEVSRQVIALRGEYDTRLQDLARAELNLRAAAKNMDTAKAMRDQGTVDQKTATDAELALGEAQSAVIDAKAKMTSLATELQQLLKAAAVHVAQALSVQPPAPRQPPRGPMVQKVVAALDSTILGLDFSEVPLRDVVRHLEEVAKVSITVDTNTVADYTITLILKDVSLAAALQAIEDLCPDLAFVVRDYGLLATHAAQAEEKGYVRIRDLRSANPAAEAPKAAGEPPAPAKDKPPAPPEKR